MMQTWLTAAATLTAVAEQTHCEQQPRDFVHLIAVTTALHNSTQQSFNLTTFTLCNFVQCVTVAHKLCTTVHNSHSVLQSVQLSDGCQYFTDYLTTHKVISSRLHVLENRIYV